MSGGIGSGGLVRITAGRTYVVAVDRHAEDARRMLAGADGLYDAAARDPAARPLQGRGVAYAVRLPASGVRAVVRHNRHGGLLAPLTRDLFLPPTRAPRELETSRRLLAAGVPTPDVLMYGCTPAALGLQRADVVTAEVDGGRDLSTFMSREAGAAARAAAWAATHTLLRTMQAAGVRHHDLNVKNVLLAERGDGLMAWLLDVDRVAFGAPGSARLAAANLARLLRSARKWRDERGAVFDERELAVHAEPAVAR